MNQYGMDKSEIKTLCESDDKLQWWAMILFAEIAEAINICQYEFDAYTESVVRNKVKEFSSLVIMRQIEKANDSHRPRPIGELPFC